MSLNFFTQRVTSNLCGKLLKLNFLRYLAWTENALHKMLFLPLSMPSIVKRSSIIYQSWKIENNIINIGGAINHQVGHVYTEATYIYIYIYIYIYKHIYVFISAQL